MRTSGRVIVAILIGWLISWAGYLAYLQTDNADEIPRVTYGSAPDHSPAICLGMAYSGNSYLELTSPCPPHHAYFANDDAPGARAWCCKMPAEDILTDEHFHAMKGGCPDNFVATGPSAYECGDKCSVRCTRINTDRYMLAPARKAFYWSSGNQLLWGRQLSKRVSWDTIPAAIRYSVGRSALAIWDNDGCIGVPFGSLLVKHHGKSCSQTAYRELLFRDGTAVRMFPDCRNLEPPESINPKCLN